MVGLGDMDGGDFDSGASSVSGDGAVIVGWATSATGYEPFRWSLDTGMVGLGHLGGSAYTISVRAISDDGQTLIGSRRSTSGTEAFRYTEADGMVGLGDLPGGDFYSVAYVTSADGSVVAGMSSYAEPDSYEYDRIFRWTEDTGMVNLFIASSITGMSADGSTIVGFGSDYAGYYPFRWIDGQGYRSLNLIGSVVEISLVFDVSADGSIVVGDSFENGPPKAAIWDEVHGARHLQDMLDDLGLDLTGWELSRATNVSDDGLTIAGYGINPDGHEEAFIARLPEPGVFFVLGAGAFATLLRRR